MLESHWHHDKCMTKMVTRGYLKEDEFFDALAEESGVIYAVTCKSNPQKYNNLKKEYEQRLRSDLRNKIEEEDRRIREDPMVQHNQELVRKGFIT